MNRSSDRTAGMMLPAALLLCIVTVALSTALQRSQHDLAVSSRLEALDLRARHAVDAAVAWNRAAASPEPRTRLAIGGFTVELERIGPDLVVRAQTEGYRHRELRRVR